MAHATRTSEFRSIAQRERPSRKGIADGRPCVFHYALDIDNRSLVSPSQRSEGRHSVQIRKGCSLGLILGEAAR